VATHAHADPRFSLSLPTAIAASITTSASIHLKCRLLEALDQMLPKPKGFIKPSLYPFCYRTLATGSGYRLQA